MSIHPEDSHLYTCHHENLKSHHNLKDLHHHHALNYLLIVFHMEFVGMFMIYLHTKFQITD
jgi:hypothetical protein